MKHLCDDRGVPLPFTFQIESLFFVACQSVCCDLGYLGERNDRVFRGRERNPNEVWSLARFHVSLWALVLKAFCNYSLSNILLSWNPFF